MITINRRFDFNCGCGGGDSKNNELSDREPKERERSPKSKIENFCSARAVAAAKLHKTKRFYFLRFKNGGHDQPGRRTPAGLFASFANICSVRAERALTIPTYPLCLLVLSRGNS